MSNMSYCRFQNTVTDFRDCLEALEEENSIESQDEKRAAIRMLKMAAKFLHNKGIIDQDGKIDEEQIEQVVADVCHHSDEEEV